MLVVDWQEMRTAKVRTCSPFFELFLEELHPEGNAVHTKLVYPAFILSAREADVVIDIFDGVK